MSLLPASLIVSGLIVASSLSTAQVVSPVPSQNRSVLNPPPALAGVADAIPPLPPETSRVPIAPKDVSYPPARPRLNPAPVQVQTAPAQAAPAETGPFQFDAITKEYIAQPGDQTAHFTFSVTNISNAEAVINWVRPSCGCTVAKLPPTPWKMAPGEGGTMDFSLDLRGKSGILHKYISMDTSHGQKLLSIRATIPAAPVVSEMDERTRNMQLAMADRQVVFRGDCAKCHSEPTVGRKGEALFTAACSICHEAPHRATMVPDLKTVAGPTTKEYWKLWITHGKAGTLMPAFAKSYGGPLDQEQIDSLVDYLVHQYPSRKVPGTTTAAADH